MKIDIHNKLVDKAKTRKDGAYSFGNYLFAVKNHCFVAYSDYSGNIFQIIGVFHTQIGTAERHNRKNKLNSLLK